MPTLRCTRKILARLDDKVTAASADSRESLLGDWHVNLLTVERRKCLLFVNDRTLLTFMIPSVRQQQLRSLPSVFRDGLREMLRSEELAPHVVDTLLAEYEGDLAIGPTTDRSVLGSMNELAMFYRDEIAAFGGLAQANLVLAARRNNRIPHVNRQPIFAIDALNEILVARFPPPPLESEQQAFIDALTSRLGDDRAAAIVLKPEDITPPFASIPQFMAACAQSGIECFLPSPSGPGVHPIELHVRHNTLFTRLGLGMPEPW